MELSNPTSFHGFTDSANGSRNSSGSDGFVLGNATTIDVNAVAVGATFDFLSFGAIDLNGSGYFGPGFAPLQFTGFLSGGGTVVSTFDLVNDTFLTHTMPTGFTNLTGMQIRGALNQDAILDTLVFDVTDGTSVPEPSTITILAGMMLLGWWFSRNRRQTVV